MSVNVRWLGTAGVELIHNGQAILIDPYLSRPSIWDILFTPLLPRKDIIEWYLGSIEGKVRAVVVGHTHFDHALDIPEIAHRLDCTILGGISLDALLDISGLPGKTTICHPQEQIVLSDKATLIMIPSVHGLVITRLLHLKGNIDRALRPPLRANQYRLGDMFALKITIGGVVFLHIGSAGFLGNELEGHRCDVLFLCVAGWKSSAGYPERVIEIAQPSCVVPIHFDNFSKPLFPGQECPVMKFADLEGFTRHVRMSHPGVEVRQLNPFMSASF
jgi:L-ascorbate metabolism protein UlaG (beta-lactamase superfamily)